MSSGSDKAAEIEKEEEWKSKSIYRSSQRLEMVEKIRNTNPMSDDFLSLCWMMDNKDKIIANRSLIDMIGNG